MTDIIKETLGQQAAITAVDAPESGLFLFQRTDLGSGQKSSRKMTPNELRKLIKNRDEVVTVAASRDLANTDLGKTLLVDASTTDITLTIPSGLNQGKFSVIKTIGGEYEFNLVAGSGVTLRHWFLDSGSQKGVIQVFKGQGEEYFAAETPLDSESARYYLLQLWENSPTGSLDAYPLHAGTLLEKIEEAIGATGWHTIASQGEAEAGTNNTKQMTPLRVAQAIAALASGGGALNNWTATTDPGATNDTTEGYAPGSTWFNSVGGDLFRCTDATEDAAIWVNVSGLSLGDLAAVAVSGSAADLSDLVSVLAAATIYAKASEGNIDGEADNVFTTPAGVRYALEVYLEAIWDNFSNNTFDAAKLSRNSLAEHLSGASLGSLAPSYAFFTENVSGSVFMLFEESASRRFILTGDTDFEFDTGGTITPEHLDGDGVTQPGYFEIDNTGGHAVTYSGITWLTPEPTGSGVHQILVIHNQHSVAPDSVYGIDFAASGQMTGSQIETVLDAYLGSAAWRTIASQAEAEAGSINNKFMTPLRVAEAIAAQAGTGGTLGLPHTTVVNTNRDLAASDIDKLILVTCTTQDVNLSVPAGLSDSFACMVLIASQSGGYKCTITENGGSITGGNPIILVPKDPIVVKHIGSDNFEIYGNDPVTFGLRTITGTSATATETDNEGIIEMDNASPNTVEFPADATEDLPVGFSTTVVQQGAGATTITFESPATGSSKNGFVLDGEGAAAVVYKRGANDYRVIGELTA